MVHLEILVLFSLVSLMLLCRVVDGARITLTTTAAFHRGMALHAVMRRHLAGVATTATAILC